MLSEKKERLVYLDAFRGLSALWVLLYHYNHFFGKDYDEPLRLQQFLENGYLGVAFFFVISAFSMGLSSDRHKEDSISYFYIRRFFRIAPLYYVVLAIGITFFYGNFSYFELGLNLLFAYNFFEKYYSGMVWAGWTIGVEMPFYLIFPFIWMGIRRFKNYGFLIFTILSSAVVYYHYQQFKELDNGVFWIVSFFRFFLVFVLGLWVYIFSLKLKGINKSHYWGNLLFCFGLALLICNTFNIYRPIFELESIYSGIFFSMILLGATVSNYRNLLDNVILKWLGRNSYSIYLLHMIVINRLDSYCYNFFKYRTQSVEITYYVTMLFTIIATCFLSEIAWRCIEKPGMDLGNRLILKLKHNKES